jgi:hypothetical protein
MMMTSRGFVLKKHENDKIVYSVCEKRKAQIYEENVSLPCDNTRPKIKKKVKQIFTIFLFS